MDKLTLHLPEYQSRSVNAVVLPTCCVILRIIPKTDIMLTIDKRQSVKMTSRSVKFICPQKNISVSNDPSSDNAQQCLQKKYNAMREIQIFFPHLMIFIALYFL